MSLICPEQVGILVPFTLGFEKLYMGDKEQCLFIVDEESMLGALQVRPILGRIRDILGRIGDIFILY